MEPNTFRVTQQLTVTRMLSAVALLLAPLLWANEALALSHYVRAGATGNGSGSDWANACRDFTGSCTAGTLKRGDTYYVACGHYASVNFSAPNSGTTNITVLAATSSNHGTDTGWSTSFGVDSGNCQAVFANRVQFSTSYWTFDGQYRSTETHGHGFLVDNRNSPIAHNLILQNGLTNITAGYTEIYGEGTNSGLCLNQIYLATATGGTNHRFHHLYAHDGSSATIMSQSTNGVIWEYNYLARNHSDAVCHAEAIADQGSDNLTIRYNKFVDIEGTGVIVALGRGADLAEDNWHIHGNLFYQTGSRTYGNGAIACINGETCSNWFIYNNTFYNNVNNSRVNMDSTVTPRNIMVVNNIFYGVRNAQHSATVTADHNIYFSGDTFSPEPNQRTISSSPFMNAGSFDLRLTTALDAGATLAAPYTIDPIGVKRGLDGTWDRGAYEYTSGVDAVPPQPPVNLHVN